jgi:hypothetical protein
MEVAGVSACPKAFWRLEEARTNDDLEAFKH